MKKLWSDIWALHDMSGFGHMHDAVPGVHFYCDRALLLPAQAVIVHENGAGGGLLEEYEAFLRRPEIDLGPQRVIRVKGEDLFGGVMCDPSVLGELRRATMHGSRAQVFCMTPRAESFFREAMIDQRDIDSAPMEIAGKMNDKARLRETGRSIGLGHAFLESSASRNPRRIHDAVRTLLSKSESEVPFVVLKRTNLAGGDGFLRVSRTDDTKEALDRYLSQHAGKKILVEEGHAGIDLSMQLAVRGKSVRVLGWTRQIVGSDGRHRGNTMAWKEGPGNPHAKIENDDRVTMETWSRILTEDARDSIVSYGGTIGFDFLRIRRPKKDGRRFFVLECNARQTASTYPLAVSAQLEGRGLKAWFIIMLNGVRTKTRSFGELEQRLGKLLFHGSLGVLPFNIRLMTLPEPQTGLIVVGRDFAEAGKMLGEAKRLLLT